MDTELYFKSVLEADPAPVVLCDLNHTVVYMNPAAVKRYGKYGGAELLGKSLLLCHNEESRRKIEEVLERFRTDLRHSTVYESRNEAENKDVYIVALRDGSGTLIGYYEKHEYRTKETAAPYEFTD